MRSTRPAAALPIAILMALVGCQAHKSSNPLSPTVAGPIAGVEITQPVLVEPPQGIKLKESQQPIKLVVDNAHSNGQRPITYTFEVATDSNFETKVFARAGVPPGDGRTSVQVDRLDLGRAYYWRAKAEDGANSGLFATAQFEVLPKPQLSAPGLLSPINNDRVASRRPTFTISNSQRNAAVGELHYDFQVALDQAFTKMVASGIADEGGGQTTFTPNNDLPYDLQHFWRVRSFDQETQSAWAATQTFRAPVTPAPAPTPTPGPAPNPGAPCDSKSPLSIVTCERNKYGHMSSGDLLNFERATARSLNRNGIPEGPFGILRKAGGSNCGGYSCDIVCSGQGNSQKQWDILGDAEGAQVPGWGGPKTAPNIRQDVCEIQ